MIKKIFVLAVVAALIVVLANCSTPNNRYYIKYEAQSTGYSSDDLHVKVNTERGSQEFRAGSSYSETFGPVKRNFHAKIQAYRRGANTNVRIYVCKGDEEFVLKANGSSMYSGESNPASAECWVDF
jgi:hypothetical protein